MSRESRDDHDGAYDAWKCDDVEPHVRLTPSPRILPPELVAAEEARRAEAASTQTFEERRAKYRDQQGPHMQRFRAATRLQFFRDSRRY